MSEIGVILIIFFCLLVLVGLALYFVLIVPANRLEVRRRLEGLAETQQEVQEARPDVLGGILLSIDEALSKFSSGQRLRLFVLQSGTPRGMAYWIFLSVALGFGAVMLTALLHPPLLLSLAMLLIFAGTPFAFLSVMRHRRLSAFESQFPDALDVLARSVRAGYAFTTGLQVVADEMGSPVCEEFRKTFEQQNLGLPLRDALANLAVRVPLPDVRIFVSTLQIQNDIGGNLAEVLDNLTKVIRERFRLLRQIRVYAAEGRLSIHFLTAFPPFLAVIFFFLNRGYIERLFNDPLGQRMVAGAVILQVVGYLIMRRMVNIRI